MNAEIKNVCFPVEKVSSVDLMENKEFLFNTENDYAIVARIPRAGNRIVRKVLNFCSEIYNLLENKTILEPLMPLLNAKFKGVEVSARSEKDARFFVSISPAVPQFSVNSEVIRPSVFFVNSYDGKLKAKATGGLVRYLVDKKGNVTKSIISYLKGYSFQYEFKHSNGAIYSMEELSIVIDHYLTNFKKVEDLIESLETIVIPNPTEEKINAIVRRLVAGTQFPTTVITGKDIKGVVDLSVHLTVMDRIKYEMEIFGDELNFWTLYNSIKFVLENHESKMTEAAKMTVDNAIFEAVAEMVPKKSPVSTPIHILAPEGPTVPANF